MSSIFGTGLFATISAQVDKTHAALRASLRPPEVGVYGSYRMALKSGVIAAGLTGPLPIWEMRWGQSSVIAIIRKVRIQAVVSATAFGATAADSSFSLYRAQGFTALDTTNGSVAAFTATKTQNAASRMASSQMAGDTTATRTGQGGIVILNTSASGLTGGTKVVDTNPIGIVLNHVIASAAAETTITPDPMTYLIDPAEGPTGSPVELSGNEGLVLNVDAIGATGTWRVAVDIAWDEVDPARYFG